MTPEEIAEGRQDLINARKLLATPGVWTQDFGERCRGCMCILDAVGWAALGEASRAGPGALISYDSLRILPSVRLLYEASAGDFNELEDIYGLNDSSTTDLEMILDVLDSTIKYAETM